MLKLNDIKNLLQHNRITEFAKLNKLTPRDIADFTNRHSQWAVKLFQHLDTGNAARAFKFQRKKKQEDIFKSLPEEKAAELLNALQPDDRTAFLEDLSGNHVKELLKILTPERRAETLELLGYKEDSVGQTPDGPGLMWPIKTSRDLPAGSLLYPAARAGYGDTSTGSL